MIWQSLLKAVNAVGWDLFEAVYKQEYSISTGPTTSEGMYIKPDGTKMFITDQRNVYQYDLSTPWSVATASPAGNFSLSSQSTDVEGLHFKPDGTIMYVPADPFYVYQYSLSTAWDVTTATFSTSLNIGGSTSNGVETCFFKPDGTKVYIARVSGTTSITEHNLSTAWDISTATFFQETSSISLTGGIYIRPNGTELFTSLDGSSATIAKYSLLTPWDISTASLSQNINIASRDNIPEDLFFRRDGKKMYVLGDQNNVVLEYDL